jgi:hypothetical protein
MFTGGTQVKKTTKRILEKFPKLEGKIVANESCLLAEEALKSYRTFLKLAWFFEDPNKADFHLSSLYQHLDNGWLEWALELITLYFREDTYLIQKPSYSIIKEGGSHYLNQS